MVVYLSCVPYIHTDSMSYTLHQNICHCHHHHRLVKPNLHSRQTNGHKIKPKLKLSEWLATTQVCNVCTNSGVIEYQIRNILKYNISKIFTCTITSGVRLIRSLTPAHWESRQQCSLIRHPHLDEWIEKGRERGGYWRHPSTVLSHFRHSARHLRKGDFVERNWSYLVEDWGGGVLTRRDLAHSVQSASLLMGTFYIYFLIDLWHDNLRRMNDIL